MPYYPSKSGSSLGHFVERTITGYTCSCGYDCWAIKKEIGKDTVAKILGKKPEPEYVLPDFDFKRQEQIEYARRPIYKSTLEDARRAERQSRELCERSLVQYKKYQLSAYYARFIN